LPYKFGFNFKPLKCYKKEAYGGALDGDFEEEAGALSLSPFETGR
jgi:hypothetical protein